MGLEFFLYHATFLSIALLLSQSLNLTWRADRFSLGHHGFFGIGAYSAVVVLKLAEDWFAPSLPSVVYGPVLLATCLAVAIIIGLAAGKILHVVFRRLTDDYFAVATLVFAEITRNLFSNWEYVGGALGFEAPYLIVSNSRDDRMMYVVMYATIGLAMNVALFFSIWRLRKSTYWLWIDACRHDRLSTEMCGVEASEIQGSVFVIGAGCAALAGAMFANFTTFVVPDDFSFTAGLPIVLYVVLGRLDPIKCLAATVAMYSLYEAIKLRLFGLLGDSIGEFVAEWKDATFAVLLVVAVIAPALLSRRRIHNA